MINYYNIAGLNISVSGLNYDYFLYRLRNYRCEKPKETDIIINYEEAEKIPTPEGEKISTSGFRIFLKNGNNYINYDTLKSSDNNTALISADSDWSGINAKLFDVEDLGGASLSVRSFNMVGEILKYCIIKRKGIVIHSSSLSYKNQGIIFSAPSGTGKSTHTRLWQKVYGNDVTIINDDMPILRNINGSFHLCGTPWCGKTEINKNEIVPLKAVVFLERGKSNEIKKAEPAEAVFRIFSQTTLPVYKDMLSLVMENIDELIKTTPVYILKCTIDEEAPKLVARTCGME